MTDQELLEYAAKSVGLKRASFVEESSWGWGITHEDDEYDLWNPLAKDWHAFRLAVQLGLVIHCPRNNSAFAVVGEYPFSITERINGDPYAATRRAIVRAAAEIGRDMSE